MNEELKSRLTGYLDYLETAVKKGGDFVGEQAPEVAREFVLMHRIESCAIVSVSIVLLLAAVVVGYRCRKLIGMDVLDKRFNAYMSGGLVSVTIGLVGTVLFASKLHAFVLAWFAPRVLILEEIAKLVK